MIECGFSLSRFWLMLQGSILLLTMLQPARGQSAVIEGLMNELPACSVLHRELERGEYGDGIDQSYMNRMRQQGVQRALVEMSALIRRGKPSHLQIQRRLYFRQFDGPNNQITDEASLTTIQGSGLEAELDAIARVRAREAPFFKGEYISFDSRISSVVEFFASAWLTQKETSWSRTGHPEPLTKTVIPGDAVGTQALLNSHRFSKQELNRALFGAVLSSYDNTAVIRLLLVAGADVNARTKYGTTPLMNAVAHPCNLRPLLDSGADLGARDKWGRNVLDLARHATNPTAMRILEEAKNAGTGTVKKSIF